MGKLYTGNGNPPPKDPIRQEQPVEPVEESTTQTDVPK